MSDIVLPESSRKFVQTHGPALEAAVSEALQRTLSAQPDAPLEFLIEQLQEGLPQQPRHASAPAPARPPPGADGEWTPAHWLETQPSALLAPLVAALAPPSGGADALTHFAHVLHAEGAGQLARRLEAHRMAALATPLWTALDELHRQQTAPRASPEVARSTGGSSGMSDVPPLVGCPTQRSSSESMQLTHSARSNVSSFASASCESLAPAWKGQNISGWLQKKG